MQPIHPLRRLVCWLTALFLVVVGAKLWLIQGYASQVPYYDQWVEANHFFKPWLDGHLTWDDWIASHNGHRIFFTRLLDLAGVALNGEWDPGLQLTINALLHASFICGLVYCLWVFSGRQDQSLLCLLLVPFFALPVAAENTLWGFQSQFYFLIGFAIVTMAGLGFHPPGSPGWLLGLVAAVLSLFTMGSGFLASLAVAGLQLLRMLRQRRLSRDPVITAGAGLAVCAVGVVLGARAGVPSPHSPGTVLATLAWTLAWPFENKPTLLLFTCLPLALTLLQYCRGGFQNARAPEFLLTLGLWGFLQSAALAYARTDQVNCSRYADLFSILSIASLASLFLLGGGGIFQPLSPGRLAALAVAWTFILLWGVWNISPRHWRNLDDADNYPLWSAQTRLIQAENIRAYVANGNPGPLLHYPDASAITNALSDPQLSRILPADCRPPFTLEKDAGSDDAFVPGGCPPGRPPREFARAWGSYSTNGAAGTGRFVSQPLTATLPKLDLQVCCAPDAENIRIELVELSSGRRLPVCPQVTGRWQVVTVDTPKSPFRLEINDRSPTAWVAVGDLKDLGRFSFYARCLIAQATLILLAGLLLFVALAGHAALRRVAVLNPYAGIRWAAFLVTMAALVGVWSARNANANLPADLYANCAKNFSPAGHREEARRFLREALWLRPDDAMLLQQLRALSEPSPR